jgi:hypothetical protein
VAKKKSSHFDAAGWTFWIIVFGVLLGPAIWGMWIVKTEEATWLFPLGKGTVLSAIAAGVVTWAVNAVLQYRGKKQRLAERKSKKAKKR